jgi:hypothetical protein
MATNRYFRFAGQPQHHMSNWHGLPPAPVRRGSRELGAADFFESSAPPFTRYRPLTRSWQDHARGEISTFMREGSLPTDLSGGPPMRPSGPEPLDPGEMPSWEAGYPAEPFAMPVGASADEITMPPLDLRTAPPSPGFLGLSRNESRLLMIGGVAAVGYFLWKKQKGPKSNPGRGTRRTKVK